MSSPLQARATECFGGVYRGRRVLITGHTGFKGSWLAEWLIGLGADVTGYSLPPPTQPALFEQLELAGRLNHVVGDVRNLDTLADIVARTQPEFVFHLAAQPLVRLSYARPVETYATNVMGTVHAIEAVRMAGRRCNIVAVTTDKCYENREWLHSYREDDPMGGHDPYSSSKGAAELVIAAYRRSYFAAADSPIRLASARAGNVIGGGDWALDRIVPDCVRALQRADPIQVRNRAATRPWQHVLEPLSGYLWLGACLAEPKLAGGSRASASRAPIPTGQLTSAFNFGPAPEANRSVEDLVLEVLKHWPGRWEDRGEPKAVHEASLLSLATERARHLLGWKPVWNFEETIAATLGWYREISNSPAAARALTVAQIESYIAASQRQGLRWSSHEA